MNKLSYNQLICINGGLNSNSQDTIPLTKTMQRFTNLIFDKHVSLDALLVVKDVLQKGKFNNSELSPLEAALLLKITNRRIDQIKNGHG